MRRRLSKRLQHTLATATTAIALLIGLAAPAAATTPVTLESGYVTDTAGVLSPTEKTQAEAQLDELARTSSVTLFVVFVDTFTEPADRQAWADTVANNNGLGPNQYLLAVAVDGRQYYISADQAGPVSESRLTQIESSIQPHLSDSAWFEAITVAADGFANKAASGGGGGGIFIGIIVVGAAAVVVGIVIQRRRRTRNTVAPATPTPAGPYDDVSDQELERRAGSALVHIDDALASSREDLGFAIAQFGDEATATFVNVVEQAQAKVSEAFGLRQKLDDEIPDTDAQRRAWHIQIIELCEQADEILEQNVEAFDDLRRLEDNAETALQHVTTRRNSLEPAVTAAPAVLAQLQMSYSNEALSTVIDNPAHARSRLQLVDSNIADASALLSAGRRGEAAFAVRTAEEGVVQAEQLTHALTTISADLERAEEQVRALIADLEGDLVTASRLSDPSGQLARTAAETRTHVDDARAQLTTTPRNPLALLETLTTVNTRIDTLVARVHDAQQQTARLQRQLDQVLVQAQARISSAGDYITTRRGAIGPTARTRYSQAESAYQSAIMLRATDPAGALEQARLSLSLAQQATASAQSDLNGYGAWGGNTQSSLRGDILGGILGGIIASGMQGGATQRSQSPWGGSSSWRSSTPRSSSGGGSFRPSSFGGSSGRSGGGRGRSGGGRF